MHLSASAEADAPADFAAAQVCDMRAHEARTRDLGIEVHRLEGPGFAPEPDRPGAAWRLAVDALGAHRTVRVRLVAIGAHGLELRVESGGVAGDVAVRVAPLGAERSRISVEGTFGADGLGARMALGSIRLAQSRIDARLRSGLEGFAAAIGARWAARERGP